MVKVSKKETKEPARVSKSTPCVTFIIVANKRQILANYGKAVTKLCLEGIHISNPTELKNRQLLGHIR